MHVNNAHPGSESRGGAVSPSVLNISERAPISSALKSQTHAVPHYIEAHKNVNLQYMGGVCVEGDL